MHLSNKSRFSTVLAMGVLATAASSARAAFINISNPSNVLTNASTNFHSTVVASSGQAAFGGPAEVVDDLATDVNSDGAFIFAAFSPETLSISGFSAPSGFTTLRFFHAPEDGQRVPSSITARSSTTSTTSLTSTDYETALGTISGPYSNQPYDLANDPSGARRAYFDLAVSAPAGTQSIFLSFAASSNGSRIYEVQALVPEPATTSLACIAGGAGLLRRRRARA